MDESYVAYVDECFDNHEYNDDTDDDNDHKNDSYTAAGAAPGASIPCSFQFFSSVPLFWFLCPGPLADVSYLWVLSDSTWSIFGSQQEPYT